MSPPIFSVETFVPLPSMMAFRKLLIWQVFLRATCQVTLISSQRMYLKKLTLWSANNVTIFFVCWAGSLPFGRWFTTFAIGTGYMDSEAKERHQAVHGDYSPHLLLNLQGRLWGIRSDNKMLVTGSSLHLRLARYMDHLASICNTQDNIPIALKRIKKHIQAVRPPKGVGNTEGIQPSVGQKATWSSSTIDNDWGTLCLQSLVTFHLFHSGLVNGRRDRITTYGLNLPSTHEYYMFLNVVEVK
jgi:hypothetical protein